jgi:hypothetical protein
VSYLKIFNHKIELIPSSSRFLKKIKLLKLSLLSFFVFFFSNTCFATDILKDQAADAIDTFKGTVLTLIIVAEIVGAYGYWHKSRDLKGTITGLVFVLLLTGWAATKV